MKRILLLVIPLLLLAEPSAAEAQTKDRVTIHVAGLFHSSRFVVETLPSQPLIVHAGTRTFIVGQFSSQRISVVLAGNQMQIQAPDSSFTAPSISFTAKSSDADFILTIPSRFHRYYHGTLTISAKNSELVPVVSMDVETAVASVVAAEASDDTPLEALKALAVAARSYLVASAPRHHEADFCDTTHCQFLRNPPPPEAAAYKATTETRGLVLRYSNKTIPAMYSASCSGRTHSLAELGLTDHGYPYFPVECRYCREHPDNWSSHIAAAQAVSAAKGERERILLARQLGWNVVPSNDFKVNRTDRGAELSGLGHGHGLGLCERGAAAMARSGSDFRAILSHYYPNTVVDSIHP